MKAIALKTNDCERYYKGRDYKVLQLTKFAMRISTPLEKRKTRTVGRVDFTLILEPRDSDELIKNL